MPVGYPKTFRHVRILCLVLEGAGTEEVVGELEEDLGYAALYLRINSSNPFGWMNVFASW